MHNLINNYYSCGEEGEWEVMRFSLSNECIENTMRVVFRIQTQVNGLH